MRKITFFPLNWVSTPVKISFPLKKKIRQTLLKMHRICQLNLAKLSPTAIRQGALLITTFC